MISLPDMWWGFIGSLDMPEYEEMRSPIGCSGISSTGAGLGGL